MELKSFFRYLGRNKTYTLINVIGFALSLAFVILTMAYTWQESTVDHFHEDADRIQLAFNQNPESGWQPGDDWIVAEALKGRFSDVEDACPVYYMQERTVSLRTMEQEVKVHASFSESNFFTFFSFPLVSGEPGEVLQDPYSVVLSEPLAQRLFGKENPIGQSLKLDDSVYVKVSGVMKPFRNSLLSGTDVLLPMPRTAECLPYSLEKEWGYMTVTLTFVKMHPGHDMNDHRQEVLEFYKEQGYGIFDEKGFVNCNDVWFVPLKEVHLGGFKPSVVSAETWHGQNVVLRYGDAALVRLLWTVSILVLLFAIINYINLTLASSEFRVKEAATRRLLGAARWSVQLRLMSETVFLTFLSFLIGLLLALAFEPEFSGILQKPVDMGLLFSPGGVALAVLLLLVVGLVAGGLPSVLISSFKPIDIVNGRYRLRSKMSLGKTFLVFQYMATFLMLSLSVVISMQIRHLIKAPLGYDTLNVLEVEFPGWNLSVKQVVSDKLSALPCVKRFGWGVGSPLSGGSVMAFGNVDGSMELVPVCTMDSVAFDLFGFEVLRDNRASVPGGYFLTPASLAFLNTSLDADMIEGLKLPISGVVQNIRLSNILQDYASVLIQLSENVQTDYMQLWVEVQGNAGDAYKEVDRAIRETLEDEFRVDFMDAKVRDSFVNQLQLQEIVTLFSLVALLVSVLGLVAMSVFYMRQRLKEVAVRKVFGADNRQVFWHLVKPFMTYVAIGIVLGLPLAWYLSETWLKAFSYRLHAYGWLFLPVAAFCLLVSFAAVGIQGRIASRTNPAENIKTE